MRECWINVYPNITVAGQVYCGPPQPSRGHCDVSAIGWAAAEESGRSVAKDLRYVGVGYRLHVRIKPNVGVVTSDGCRYIDREVMPTEWIGPEPEPATLEDLSAIMYGLR